MNTSITLSPKITNTAPKPTKAQLVEALVARACAKHNEEQDAIREKRQEIRELIEEEARKEFAKFIFELDSISVYESHNRPHINFRLKEYAGDFSTPKIKALLLKLKPLKTSHFDEKATKDAILAGLKPANPLIDNEDTTKALDALLATIMGAPKVLSNTVDV